MSVHSGLSLSLEEGVNAEQRSDLGSVGSKTG